MAVELMGYSCSPAGGGGALVAVVDGTGTTEALTGSGGALTTIAVDGGTSAD